MTTASVLDLRLHRQSDLVPSMAPDEYDALYEDIEKRGIETPIDVTAAGTVLDGRHRYAIATSLGLAEVPVRVVETDDEIGYMIRAALLRRHLTTAQRKALAARLLVQAPERSDRQVARETGIHHETVAAVRHQMEALGDVAETATRTDTLGRQQPVIPTPVHSPSEMVITDLHRERHPESTAALEAAERRARLARAINEFGKGLDALRLADFADDLDALDSTQLENLRRCVRLAGKWTDEWATAIKPRRLHVVEGAAQ